MFNVEVTGAARFYRAASELTAGLAQRLFAPFAKAEGRNAILLLGLGDGDLAHQKAGNNVVFEFFRVSHFP